MPKTKDQITTNGRAVFYTVLWPSFRQSAIDCGWTLALHGSMASDMDIMAMPWVEDAKPVEELVKALSDCIDGTMWKDHHFKPFSDKPHGRIVYTLSIFSDFYIDLSIQALTPLQPNEKGETYTRSEVEGLLNKFCNEVMVGQSVGTIPKHSNGIAQYIIDNF